MATVRQAPRERPILFSAPMVRAILDGRKTQTRRIACSGRGELLGWTPDAAVFGDSIPDDPLPMEVRNRYGAPGDRLWLKETHALVPRASGCEHSDSAQDHERQGVRFKATWDRCHSGRWRPSIHMPRWASRITLEVTGVRVERLQAITEEDARAEGVAPWTTNTLRMADPNAQGPMFRLAFEALWDDINGKRAAWATNPWVWVVSFKRVRP